MTESSTPATNAVDQAREAYTAADEAVENFVDALPWHKQILTKFHLDRILPGSFGTLHELREQRESAEEQLDQVWNSHADEVMKQY